MKHPMIRHLAATIFVAGIVSMCTNPTTALTDAQQLAALRKVTVTCDSMTYEFGFPQGALSGKSFDSLKAEDSATYSNPANYSITVVLTMTADNTKPDADDAKFDGMHIDAVMDTIVSSPIRTVSDPFTVGKGSKKAASAHGRINLATHRKTGLYIFKRTVEGTDLVTTLSPVLNYKIGTAAGTIPLPDIRKNIPTRASEKTKNFLAGLIASGIFEN